MINVWVKRTCISYLTICLAILLQINLAKAEPYKSWTELTSIQQEALKPLATQWNSLPDKLQGHLLHAANQYQKLIPEQKHRFQNRLDKWSKLTPEQRESARNKFKAISKAPPEKREQLRRMVQEQEASKITASSVPASTTVR